MDGCAGKRSVDRMILPRKPTGPVLRENTKKKDDKSVPFCSRVACSAKVASTKGTRFGSTDSNTKVGRPGKEIVGSSSSRTPGGFGYLRKPAIGTGRRQPSSNLDTGSSETSSIHDDHPAAVKPILPRLKTKRGAVNVQSQGTVSGEVVGSSSRGTIRSSHQKSVLGTRETLMGPSVSSSSSGSDHAVRGGLSSKNGLRNLRCNNSVSDVLPAKSSSGTKVSVTKKKNSDGESSSSSQGSKSSVSVIKGRNQSSTHGNGTTVSDNRRNRMVTPTIRDTSVVSSGGRRSGNNSGRSGRLRAFASPATSRQTPQPAAPTNPNPSRSFGPSNSYSRPNSSTGWLRSTMPGSPSEADPSGSLVNRDGLTLYNIDGIAEVLLALERIENDQELTYEQMSSLETNLFSSGMIRFYDQHSDMRLDIDNMSYEELLALGDEMGTVSTALSEEALSRSLKRSIYQVSDETGAISLDKDDDIKCSICQEEYDNGDEVGTMPCEHMYHVSCVEQWLRMKNWCPICKTSAEEEKS